MAGNCLRPNIFFVLFRDALVFRARPFYWLVYKKDSRRENGYPKTKLLILSGNFASASQRPETEKGKY
jgi:hypothetical protein